MDGLISRKKIFWVIQSVEIVLGSIMIAQGQENMTDCKNGVDLYLYSCGIVLVVCNLCGCLLGCWKCGNRNDGTNICMLACDLCVFSVAFILFLIAGIINIIWGSYVIFGSYSSWEYEEADQGSDNYCGYTPVIIGLVFLILQWLVTPFTVVMVVFSIKRLIDREKQERHARKEQGKAESEN